MTSPHIVTKEGKIQGCVECGQIAFKYKGKALSFEGKSPLCGPCNHRLKVLSEFTSYCDNCKSPYECARASSCLAKINEAVEKEEKKVEKEIEERGKKFKRPFKFKGERRFICNEQQNEDKWVYGSLVISEENRAFIIEDAVIEGCEPNFYLDDYLNSIDEVLPETVELLDGIN